MADLVEQPIIIKKVKAGGHGHHGGAWKVAYADFVTAMMAFFLLLWLLNSTTEEQRNGIADYFSPASVADPHSGSGGILGGATISVEGNRVSSGGPSEGGMTLPLPPSASEETSGESGEETTDGEGPTEVEKQKDVDEETLEEILAKREQEQFEQAEEALRQAIESVPELTALQDSLLIEHTPEGLRIQLADQEGYSMFALGSAKPNEQLQRLINLIAQVVNQMPNKISISGHTDSRPYRDTHGYTNWELSSDRANAARRLLTDAGLDHDRVALVQGRSATEPLLPDDPTNPRNRRISIVLLRQNEAPVEFTGEKVIEALEDADRPVEPDTRAVPLRP